MMSEYTMFPLAENVEEMFIGPFGSSLKNDCFVDEESGFCMVYEQKHAIQKTMDVDTRFVDEKKYNELKRFNVRGGDIIVSCRGTIGETFVVPEDAPLGIMHPSIMKIRLKDGVYDKFYFNLLLQKRLKGHEAEANGSGIKMAISAKALGAELFPVPTMKEQTQITDVISKVQSIIDDRKMELQKLDELIKARFVELFGDPVSNSFGLTEATLPELGEFGRGVSKHRPRNDPKLLGGDYPLIQTGDVAAANLYITSYNSTYSELGLKQSKMWHKGTLCITIAANIAKTAILDFDACFPDSVVGFTANEKTSNIFIHYWFSFFQAILESQAPESAQKNINLKILSELKVIVPDKTKQDEFVAFIEQIDKSKVVVQKALHEAQLLFDSLMQQYFG